MDTVALFNRVGKNAAKAEAFFSRMHKKHSKRELFTRKDLIFLIFLTTLSICLVLGSHGSKTASQSATAATNVNGGMGGVTTPYTAKCDNPGEPACPPTTTATNPLPADPVGAINNWNGTTMTSSTYGNQGGDWLLNSDGTGHAFMTDPGLTIQQPNIQALWKVTMGVVLGCITLLIMFTGYRIMGGAVGFRHADALEALPKVILAVIAAGLSIVFVSLIITLENGLATYIIDGVKNIHPGMNYTNIVIPESKWFDDIGSFLVDVIVALFVTLILMVPLVGTLVSILGAGALAAVLAGKLLYDAEQFILVIMTLIFVVQLLVRFFTIDLYIVLAPLCIGCWALPGQMGQKIAQDWATGFLSLVFVQFVQLLCVSVGLMLLPKMPDMSKWQNWSGLGAGDNILAIVGPIAVMWLTLRIPKMFNSSAMGSLSAAGSTASGAIIGAAVAAATLGGKGVMKAGS